MSDMTISVHGYNITVYRHAIAETGVGLAGYLEAVLPDERVLFAVGRWDDDAEVDETWCAECVWIDGEPVESDAEGSLYIHLPPEPGTVQPNGLMVEDVARAIHAARGGI